MKKISVIFLGMLIVSCASTDASTAKWSLSLPELKQESIGHVVEESFYSSALQRDWSYNIYYPAGYSETNQYPVIYLLHGAYGKHTDWKLAGEAQIVLDRAIASKKIPPTLVIMPDGQDTWYSDISGTNMQSAFEKDLFPYIETNFSTINKKVARAIGGLSMGGHGALTFAMRNPEYFGSIFAISPSITELKKSPPQALLNLLEKDFTQVFGSPFSQQKWDAISYNHAYEQYKKADSPVNFFVAVGTDDIITPAEDSRALIEKFNKDKVSYKFLEVPSGSHSWGFWTLMLSPSLEFVGKTFEDIQ